MNFNILEYGAKPDGITLSTEAFNRAIIDCCNSGGGFVDVPAGTFNSGTIELMNNVYLRLLPGSKIVGSLFFNDYKGVKRGCAWHSTLAQILDFAPVMNPCPALIIADNKKNCGIVGEGTIDGRRSEKLGYTEEKGRPFLVVFSECREVLLEGVTLTNPGLFTFYSLNNLNVRIDKVKVETADSYNGDGLDFDGSKNVTISNCIINSGDDGIGLKTLTNNEPCENFVISNCIIRAKNWGAVRIGPESAGAMRNININNCVFEDSGDGFKLQLCEESIFEDFTFSNITMKNVARPFFFTSNRYSMSKKTKSVRPPAGIFRRVYINNVIATMRNNDFPALPGNFISGIPGSYIEDISLTNIHITALGGGKAEDAMRTTGHGEMYDYTEMYPEYLQNMGSYPSAALYIRHAKNVYLSNCTFNCLTEDKRCAIAAEDVINLKINDISAFNCGGILRHHSCPSIKINGCDGKIATFSTDQAAQWNKFNELSRVIDSVMQSNADLIDMIHSYPIIACSENSTLEFNYNNSKHIFLFVPSYKGDIKTTVNDTEAGVWHMPEMYTYKCPWACEITDYLVNGNNIIKIECNDPGVTFKLIQKQ